MNSTDDKKRRLHDAYFLKYLKNQVQQYPSFTGVPTQEILFAKERKYYPDKVKIMMAKKPNRGSVSLLPINSNSKYASKLPTVQHHSSLNIKKNLFGSQASSQGSDHFDSYQQPPQRAATNMEMTGQDDDEAFGPLKSLNKARRESMNNIKQLYFSKESVRPNHRFLLTPLEDLPLERTIDRNQTSVNLPSIRHQIGQRYSPLKKQSWSRNSGMIVNSNNQPISKKAKPNILRVASEVSKFAKNSSFRRNNLISLDQTLTSQRGASQQDSIYHDDPLQNQTSVQGPQLKPSLLGSTYGGGSLLDSGGSNGSTYAMEYEMRLEEKENKQNSLNKLDLKRRLIMQAVGKSKPKKERNYVSKFVQYLSKYHSTLELPECQTLMVTRQVALGKRQKGETVERKDLILRKRDCQPYYNERVQSHMKVMEPVFLSDHFNFAKQELILSKHLGELIEEVKFAQKLHFFEKEALLYFIDQQKELAPNSLPDARQELLAKFKRAMQKNKKLRPIDHQDQVFQLMQHVGNRLVAFLARDEINELPKLGMLVSKLVDLVSEDIVFLRVFIRDKLWDESHLQQSSRHKDPVELMRWRLFEAIINIESFNNTSAAPSIARSKAFIEHINDPIEEDDPDEPTVKRKPHQQPRSMEFYDCLKSNDVLKCLKMVKENPNLVDDVDGSGKSPLHWACQLDLTNLVQILIDFGASMFAKDDFARKPYDEAVAYSKSKNQPVNDYIKNLFDLGATGQLKLDRGKYEEPLYVKYLTPVEKVKELADFIKKVNDMSTLNAHKSEQSEDSDLDSEDIERQVKRVAGRHEMITAQQFFDHDIL